MKVVSEMIYSVIRISIDILPRLINILVNLF